MNEQPEAVSTPGVVQENILGVRIVAGIIDLVLLAILGIVMAVLFGDSSSDGGSFNLSLTGVPFVVYVVLSLAYYFVLENMSGQTVGKMMTHLKVVSTAGPLTPGKIAIRTLLRIVDGFGFYVVGVIVIAVSKEHQRVGDMAAGTNVVRA